VNLSAIGFTSMKRSVLSFFFCCFTIFMVIDSNGAGDGVVIITTYPVSGTVNADGTNIGKAPATINLSEGDHLITFSDYSSQYSTPSAQKIQIKAGEKIHLSGVYKNRLIPSDPPLNFQTADSLFVYGLKDRPQKDGFIFDYIDGGAIVYIRHGLRETTHVVYNRPGGGTLTLDIYDMGTPGGSKAGFEDEEICPAGYGQCEIGVPCKSYNYEPDYFIYFHKSCYLVYVSTNNDSLKKSVESFAHDISRNIQ
jgi:hypothetical protein